MAFLDWIRNRGAAQQQAVAQKPQQAQENAQQWHARRDAQELATQRRPAQISDPAKAAVKDVRSFLENYGRSGCGSHPGH